MSFTEKALISTIRRKVRTGRGVTLGIGDDCAILRIPRGHEALVTTDFSLEGVHFRREWHPAESVGHRCLTRGLSDIAAMGGQPIAAFISLAVPRDLPARWIEDFSQGVLRLARQFGVTLAGGDTAESPDGVLADIVLLGSAPQGQAVRRSGARPGDLIYVSGELGASAGVVKRLIQNPRVKLRPQDFPRHFFPEPRIKVGRFLRNGRLASAMIDISDGLSTDLGHICEESSVGAEIWEEAIPLAKLGRSEKRTDLNTALHGGEDYELLFTAPKGVRMPGRIAGVKISLIGTIIQSKRMFLKKPQGRVELKPQGWEHFRKNSIAG